MLSIQEIDGPMISKCRTVASVISSVLTSYMYLTEDKEVRTEDMENFLTEGVMMVDFKHKNVLSLIGVVYEEGDRPLVVLPYMENGDLCTFIKRDDVVSIYSPIPSK